jgi:hypothetical protein
MSRFKDDNSLSISCLQSTTCLTSLFVQKLKRGRNPEATVDVQE